MSDEITNVEEVSEEVSQEEQPLGDVKGSLGEMVDMVEESDKLMQMATDGEESDSEEDSPEEEEVLQEEIKELKKKLKLKVNGKEVEKEIDLDDEDDLKKHYQKAMAFDKTSQELASLKKQVGGLLEELKSNPIALLQQMGLNVDELAEGHITSLIEEAKKSPEQLEREKMERELSDARKKLEEAENEKKTAEMEKMRNEQAAMIETDITAALGESSSILPNNIKTVRKIAENMYFAMKNGYPQVTANDVIPLVEQQYKEELKQLFDMSPEDTIEMLVGKSNIDRLRKKRLSRKKSNTKTAKQLKKNTTGKVSSEKAPKSEAGYKNFNDFFNKLR